MRIFVDPLRVFGDSEGFFRFLGVPRGSFKDSYGFFEIFKLFGRSL